MTTETEKLRERINALEKQKADIEHEIRALKFHGDFCQTMRCGPDSGLSSWFGEKRRLEDPPNGLLGKDAPKTMAAEI